MDISLVAKVDIFGSFHLPSFGKSISLSLFGKAPGLRRLEKGELPTFAFGSLVTSLHNDGSAEFSASSWKLQVSLPNLSFADSELFAGNGHVSALKSGDFEEGLSAAKDTLKHFFVLHSRNGFVLKFKVIFLLLYVS